MSTTSKNHSRARTRLRVALAALLFASQIAPAAVASQEGAPDPGRATGSVVAKTETARMWRELQTLVASGDETAARALVARDAETARALHRELVFDAFSARLYENPPLPHSETARALLAASDEKSAALERRFAEWAAETKPGAGFTHASEGFERVLYLATVAFLRDKEKESGADDAPAGSPRELTERALALAEKEEVSLAVASLTGTLSVFALRERRLEDVLPLISRAETVWKEWSHPVGLFQAPLVVGHARMLGERPREAAEQFERAAELAKALPQLRSERVNALAMRAAALRNAGDREGVRASLAVAVEEQAALLEESKDDDARLKNSKTLADLQVQLGGALASLGRHSEAGDWYARADALNRRNYEVERASLERQIEEYRAVFNQRIAESATEEHRKLYRNALETISDTLLSQIDTLASRRGDMKTVARVAERRLEAAREGGDAVNVAKALDAVAKAHLKASDFAKAKERASEALAIRRADPRRADLHRSHALLGDIAHAAEDWNEAVKRYEEVIELTKPGALAPLHDLARETDESVRRVKAQMNDFERMSREKSALDARIAIAHAHMRRGDYRTADEMLRAVERDVPRLFAMGAPDEADLLKWLEETKNANVTSVDIYARRRGSGIKADAGEEQRLSVAELAARQQRVSILQYRAMLLEDQNDLDAAAEAYERASALVANLVGGAFTLTGTQVALARIERERGNYAAAEAPVAAALAEAVRNNEPHTVASLLSFQSALRRQEGRLEEALKLAEDAHKLASKLNSRTQTAAALRSLGRAEGALGGEQRLASSEKHLRESLSVWRELGMHAHTAYTLDSLGQTLERMGRDDEALAAYVEAVNIVESLVSSLSSEASAETFAASRGNRDLYEHLIKLLVKKRRVSEALQYLERSKSKALVDALAGAEVAAKDPKLNSLLEGARRASDALRLAGKELTDELSKPAAERDEAKIARLRERETTARRARVAAVEELRKVAPAYAGLVAVESPDLETVRGRLPEGTLLLSYFPTDSGLFIFVVKRDGEPTVRTVETTRADLSKMVDEYRRLVVPQEVAAAAAAGEAVATKGNGQKGSLNVRGLNAAANLNEGREGLMRDLPEVNRLTAKLYDALLAPASAEIERADTVLIVPSGDLYYLPVHALGRARADGSIEYLIDKVRFAYLASADLLNVVATAGARGGEREERLTAETILALGNPDGSLPGATQEVRALSRLFDAPKVFTGEQATVSRIASPQTARVPYIHFATHGVIDSRDPKESYLLLAGEPGRLSVRDLVEDTYKLAFDGTRLVTLSACNTNVGGWDPGAAYGSLSRAFSKAGAPTVIASLWSVDDDATRDTMTVFYRELAEGTPKAEALRRAQAALRANPRYSHPFFWAPFVILGEWK